MLKALPRTPLLNALRVPAARQSSSAASSAPTIHDTQSDRKEQKARDVAAQHDASQLLQKALQATDKALRSLSSSGGSSSEGRSTFVRRPREDRPARPAPLASAGGRWTTTAKVPASAPVAAEPVVDGAEAPIAKAHGYRAVVHHNVARTLLEHRRKRGIADDLLVRDILQNKSAEHVQRDRADRAVKDWYNTPATERDSPRPPFTPRGPRADRPASASGPKPQQGGPRKPREQGGPKRPFGNKRSPSAAKDPFANMPVLKNPSKVHYPTLDVASLIKADLESRALRLKAAVAAKPRAKDAEDPSQAERLADHHEQQGDYTRWFTEAGKGPEALRQARQSLATNPSIGLVEREALLKAVNDALPSKGARR